MNTALPSKAAQSILLVLISPHLLDESLGLQVSQALGSINHARNIVVPPDVNIHSHAAFQGLGEGTNGGELPGCTHVVVCLPNGHVKMDVVLLLPVTHAKTANLPVSVATMQEPLFVRCWQQRWGAAYQCICTRSSCCTCTQQAAQHGTAHHSVGSCTTLRGTPRPERVEFQAKHCCITYILHVHHKHLGKRYA